MTAEILKTGPLLTIQDLGRRSGARIGLSPGGAMDRRALLWANRLLGNAPHAACLEVTLGGCMLRFWEATVIALAGAPCPVTRSTRPSNSDALSWRTMGMAAGETLRLGHPTTGLRTYLAFPDGLEGEELFGSKSVVLREGLGGRLGQSLKTGDHLRWSSNRRPRAAAVPPSFRPSFPAALQLGFIPAYEWAEFSAEERAQWMAASWTVDAASDRVATRLRGPSLLSGPKALDSRPAVDGAVQVLSGGTPIVLMRDRPTIAGYPLLGSLVPGALDSLAQARPGTHVTFEIADGDRVRTEELTMRQFFGLHRAGNPSSSRP